MPRGNTSLSDAAITKIEQWVKEGAILDAGVNPKAPLEKIAASPEDLRKAELAKLPADQRDKEVEKVGLALEEGQSQGHAASHHERTFPPVQHVAQRTCQRGDKSS